MKNLVVPLIWILALLACVGVAIWAIYRSAVPEPFMTLAIAGLSLVGIVVFAYLLIGLIRNLPPPGGHV